MDIESSKVDVYAVGYGHLSRVHLDCQTYFEIFIFC